MMSWYGGSFTSSMGEIGKTLKIEHSMMLPVMKQILEVKKCKRRLPTHMR